MRTVPGTRKARLPRVETGADRLLREAGSLLRGKRVGILTNHTGRLTDGRHIIDTIAASGLCTLKALFGPEHGVYGDTPDGRGVDHGSDSRYGVPIYSLYGKVHKPTPAMLEGIDVLICDIQDVGARFYTYISTMVLAMEAAAEQKILFVVLDRPNPIRGLHFDGPVREQQLKTFVAWLPVPVTHGMTIGELMKLCNGEQWLANHVSARLEVVPMRGWRRSMWYDETGLPWVGPSPNMPRLDTAVVYPGLCFMEGTSLSEGRGTTLPFEVIGAPWVNPETVIRHARPWLPEGAELTPELFTPVEIPGTALNPKFRDIPCRGVRIRITRRNSVPPVRLGLAVLHGFKKAHPVKTYLGHRRFDILTGDRSVRKGLEEGASLGAITARWEPGLEWFGTLRQRYLMYDE